MYDKIEQFLFKKDGQHGLSFISMEEKKLIIKVVPWEYENREKSYLFNKLKLSSIFQIGDEPEDLEFPWDVIAVSAKKIDEELWSFCIRCSGIEYGFISLWPEELTKEPK